MNPPETSPAEVNSRIVQGYQNVDFSENADEGLSEVYASEVSVIPSPGNHAKGSSKFVSNNVVDYTWEERFYTGQLLAVHMLANHIAYGIKAKTGSNVRVVNRQTEERLLIKGMEGAVQDIAFACIPKDIILATVDFKGNLFIHAILEGNVPMTCQLILHILPDSLYVPAPGDFCRVIWCPYIPDEDESPLPVEDFSHLLALSRGKKMELWNVKMVTDKHECGPVEPGMVEIGYLEIDEHDKPIVDAAFAPDGTAVATASMDGEVKFFQVYMQNGKQPRCLHQWKPHGGEPLSSLFFMDNHKHYNPEIQFWKFAVTGANNNSEIRVWSCESWTCLQTLKFQVKPSERPVKLNACLDLSAGYLVLSEPYRRLLYVLELFSNNDGSAGIISVSEFHLPFSILSFGIVDAGEQRFKTENLEEVCNDEDDDESVLGVLVKMYLVQPKSLLSGHVSFITPKPGSCDRSNLIVEDSLMYHENLSDMSLNVSNGDISSSHPNLQELPANYNHSSSHLNLMTPDAFNSPVKLDASGSSSVKPHTEEHTYSNTTTLVASPHSPEDPDVLLMPETLETAVALGFASGGSSPSREVQEILGEGKCFFQATDDLQQDPEQIELTPPEEKVPPDTVWPEIPMLRATEVRKNEEQSNRSVNQGECSGSGDSEVWKVNQRLETSISSMILVMNSLMQACEDQGNEIKQLREEMHQQSLLREIDKIVSCNSQQQIMLLEKILAARESKQHQDALATSISQNLMSFFTTKFTDSVKDEISKTVPPMVSSQMDSLKHQIHVELTQKLSATDHLLKENITKLVHSKSVMDVLSASVVSSLTPIISQCYKEYFTNIALPSFEKSCSTMFQQINETFNKGSKEFVSALEVQSRRLSEKNRDQTVQIQGLSEILKSNMTQMHIDMKKSVTGLEKQVIESVSRALSLQQATLENTMIVAARSRTVTPAPSVLEMQQLQQSQIMELIRSGQINQAFQQALSATDLGLVMFVCERVNPQQLFSQMPCPLHQHVLLSLVQQLSADISSQTELKHKYLEEALMNLDVNNPTTRDHLPDILPTLQSQLTAYINSNSNNRSVRSLRILLMASQSLLTSCLSSPSHAQSNNSSR